MEEGQDFKEENLMKGEYVNNINTKDYSKTISRLRWFFESNRGFIEVPAQSKQSILSACEDPATISKYNFGGISYPLPQTGQMWLEHELLKNPSLTGVYCITTSYRDEPNPIEGRHDTIFPMFEFESRGNINDMIDVEEQLLKFFNFASPKELRYEYMASRYQAEILEAEHEERMQQEFGNVISLQYFPKRTQPFWNMEYAGYGEYSKVDVILHGMETIGSAQRSCNPDEMRKRFYEISDGEYANLLFSHFGKKRVEAELNEYLELPMIERYGGGIGITRLIRAVNKI